MSKEDEEDDKLRNLIEEALKLEVKSTREYKDHQELTETLGPIMSEFLDSFVVIGYDFEGTPMSFQSSPSEQQKDALDTLILRYFYQRTGYSTTEPGGDDKAL
jgi:hypothetical protein